MTDLNTTAPVVAAAAAPAAAKPAPSAKRKLATPSKPSKPVVPVKAKPAAKVEAKVEAQAKPSGNVTRTAATIVAQKANFGGLSDRDNAYMTFYASFAKKATGGVVTLKSIVDSGREPAWAGSSKPHDAGVVQRLSKAGLISIRDNGAAFVFTAKAKTFAAYTAG